MSAEGYLPPVVTKFLADISDLAHGVITGKALMADFGRSTSESMADSGGRAGRLFISEFNAELRGGSRSVLRTVISDASQLVDDDSRKAFATAGAKAASSFAGSFGSIFKPLLIAVLIGLLPHVVTALGVILSAGFGAIFLGLGALALKSRPGIIAAATQLKNDVVAVFKDSAAPLEGPFIRALEILDRLVLGAGTHLKKIFEALGPAVEPLATGFGDFVREAMPGMIELARGASTVLKEMAGQGGTVGKGLGDFFKSIADATPDLVTFVRDAGPGLASILRGTGEAVEKLAAAYAWLSDTHKSLKADGWIAEDGMTTPITLWSNVASKVGEFAKEIGTEVAGFFSAQWQSVTDWTGRTWTAVTEWVDKTSDKVGEGVGKAVDWFKALPGKIWDQLTKLPGILKNAATAAFDGFFFALGWVTAKVVRFFVTLPDTIKRGIVVAAVAAWTVITTVFQKGVDGAVFAVEELPGKIGTFFKQLWTDVTGWVERTWRDTVDWGGRLATDLAAWAARAYTDTIDWFKKLPGRAVDFLQDLVKKVGDWGAGAGRWLYQAGKDIVQGLINGVTSMIESAIDVVKRAARRIADGAREALGIRSPSTVFAEIGRHTVSGYIQGIRGSMGQISGAWRGMLAGAAPGLSGDIRAGLAGAAVAGGAGGATVVETTINVDGRSFIRAVTPAAQRTKGRTGSTGLS